MLNKDYREILQILLENKVAFLVVGAYAMSVHGYPRATGDIDIWIAANNENAKKIMKSLKSFGAYLGDIKEKDFTEPNIVFQIGIAPRRIDIITQLSGLDFDEAYQDRIYTEIDGLSIPVISVSKLIENKLATGRKKDIYDVEILKEIQSSK